MKLFKNKLFLMLFATLFAICLFNSKCFASFDFTYDNTEYSLPDLPATISDSENEYNLSDFPHFISCYSSSFFVLNFVYYPTSGQYNNFDDYKIYSNSDYIDSKIHIVNGGWVTPRILEYRYRLNSDSDWAYGGSSTFTSSQISLDNVLYSSSDIYESENSENVVFQGASQPVEETNQVVLAEIVEQQETNKVMEEILGILPIVIVVMLHKAYGV